MLLNVAAYHFAPVSDPDALLQRLHAVADAHALRGTLLVAEEGVNLFLAGAEDGVHAVLDALRAEPGFAALQAKFSRSATQPFGRLKARRKREILSFRRPGTAPLGRERAPSVAPDVLARWLAQGHDDAGRPLLLLDTRNVQEVEYGTFAGAVTPPITRFTELPAWVDAQRERLAGHTVVSFCTGGIRCEKAALWMHDAGLDNVLQLEGGILGYFEQVGGFGYEGRCFVFDGRVALDPDLRPLVDEAVPDANAHAA